MRSLNATPAILTIAYLVPISAWWTVQASMMLHPASSALATFSLTVLQALVTIQMLGMCLFIPQWKPISVVTALLPAWPLLVLLGLATGINTAALLTTQFWIALAGFVIFGVASFLQKLDLGAEVVRLSLTGLGVVAAILAWLFRAGWLSSVTP